MTLNSKLSKLAVLSLYPQKVITKCCLGSLGQNLISFQFKTKQALIYFLCFAFLHIYKGIFLSLLLTFITLLASSDSLPSNYLFFLSKPRQSTGNQKGY